MSKRGQQGAPGLTVWLALLVAAMALVLLIFNLPSQDQLERKGIHTWLARQPHGEKNRPLILMLGTSLTGCGLDSISILESCIHQLSGRETCVCKVWKLNAGPVTFAALSSSLKAAHPAVVIIEANTLFYAFRKEKGWPAYVQRFRDFVSQRNYVYEPDSKPLVLHRELKELETFRSGLMDTTQLAGFGELLQALQQQGSKIVLFNFPLEAPLEIKKWNSADTAVFFSNMNYLRRYCSLEYADQRMSWDETHFIDHAHMNTKGRQKQTLRFCRLVAEQLK
jgi:hypothetical protein